MNLQPVKIYWTVSTVNKWKAQCSGPDNLFIQQYAAYNALYYSMQFKNQRSKHVINVLSELAYIGCVTWFETSEINFDWLCLINDMCSLFVFDCCHLCLPVWMTCALECRMCFENENVFRVLLKSLSEICKLCFTMRNGLRYWQQTAQLAKWVLATANFVQPMGFSVLAIEKNCINEPIPISTTLSMTPFFFAGNLHTGTICSDHCVLK